MLFCIALCYDCFWARLQDEDGDHRPLVSRTELAEQELKSTYWWRCDSSAVSLLVHVSAHGKSLFH